MNPYLIKLIAMFAILVIQSFLILELERYWLLLKGKQSQTGNKLIEFIELPFSTYFKNKTTLKIISIFLSPIIFGLFASMVIPYLNHRQRANIDLGFPWGYIMIFSAGYFGINLFICIVYLQNYLSKKILSLNWVSILMLLYAILLLITIYIEIAIFLRN